MVLIVKSEKDTMKMRPRLAAMVGVVGQVTPRRVS
jgi:hypothetical protein